MSVITQAGTVRYGTVYAAYRYAVFPTAFGAAPTVMLTYSGDVTKARVTSVKAGSFQVAGSPGSRVCFYLGRGSAA